MRRLRADEGVVGVIVAITLVVMLGMAGFAVDAGALYQERRELRNGADAAALAIAEDCALGIGSCDTNSAAATAALFAAANAADGTSAVDSVALDLVAQTVAVATSTLDPSGSTVVDPYFMEVVGFNGATVHASAIAAWGYPVSMSGFLPLIISDCEFPFDAPLPTPPTLLFFHDGNNANPCNAQAGQGADGDGRLSGGFGWLDAEPGCRATLSVASWVGADPGSSPSNGCKPGDVTALLGTEIPLPFFDDLTGTGNNGAYHVAGFGLFHVTGYNFGGQYKQPKSSPPCSGDERCLAGYFTTGAIYTGTRGGPDYGLAIVELIG